MRPGLIPAIVQDADTRVVLMQGIYESGMLLSSCRWKPGKVCFFSRSRQRLWTKGEESGHFLRVKEMVLADCDRDSLLVKVKPVGPTCHTGAGYVLGRKERVSGDFLFYLATIICKNEKMILPKYHTRPA